MSRIDFILHKTILILHYNNFINYIRMESMKVSFQYNSVHHLKLHQHESLHMQKLSYVSVDMNSILCYHRFSTKTPKGAYMTPYEKYFLPISVNIENNLA